MLAMAPGRVNLIGEHTDYNQGFVLPAAINRNICVAIAPNETGDIHMYAEQFGQDFRFGLGDWQAVSGWPTYLLGMLYQLIPGHRLDKGLDILISGNVPAGAGMSSSAALSSAFGMALNMHFGLGRSRLDLALAAQQTEHDFAGVQCGIMDMFASLHGRAGQLLKLDCRSLEYQYIPFDFPDLRIVLVNTRVSHSLTDSAYNERRAQCEAGVSYLQRYDKSIRSLRDVPLSLLKEHEAELDPVVFRRCRFIVEENIRLLDGCDALEKGDVKRSGEKMFEAHTGLSRDFEISCPESDFIVETARHFPQVKGARQMGGGFGGCIIHLVDRDGVDDYIRDIKEKYSGVYGKDPDCWVMEIEEGAHVVGE